MILFWIDFEVIVCSIGNSNKNDASTILQIANDYLFVFYGHLQKRVESRMTSARKDQSLVIFRYECSVPHKKKERRKKKKKHGRRTRDRIFLLSQFYSI
jgi:hypothetical protein